MNESEKLLKEKILEYSRVFNDALNSKINLLQSIADISHKGLIDYTLASLRSLYLLNGGALISVPVLVSSFSILSSESSRHAIFWGCGCFILGLVAAGAANVFAYFTEAAMVQACRYLRLDIEGEREKFSLAVVKGDLEKKTESNRFDKRVKFNSTLTTVFRALMIFFIFLSIGSFANGSWFLLKSTFADVF